MAGIPSGYYGNYRPGNRAPDNFLKQGVADVSLEAKFFHSQVLHKCVFISCKSSLR